LKNGDDPYSWRSEPFQMFIDGEWWIPPEQIPDEEARLANRVKGFLGLSGQRKLLWLIRRVDTRRGSIARVMAYAMDRADAAEEVSSISQKLLTGDCGYDYCEYVF
jgi:U2-associated protein SR140